MGNISSPLSVHVSEFIDEGAVLSQPGWEGVLPKSFGILRPYLPSMPIFNEVSILPTFKP